MWLLIVSWHDKIDKITIWRRMWLAFVVCIYASKVRWRGSDTKMSGTYLLQADNLIGLSTKVMVPSVACIISKVNTEES